MGLITSEIKKKIYKLNLLGLFLFLFSSVAFASTAHEALDQAMTAFFIGNNSTQGSMAAPFYEIAAKNFEIAINCTDLPRLNLQERSTALIYFINTFNRLDSIKYSSEIDHLKAELELVKKDLALETSQFEKNLGESKLKQKDAFELESLNFWLPKYRRTGNSTLPGKVVSKLIKVIRTTQKFKKNISSLWIASLVNQVKVNSTQLNPTERSMLLKILEHWKEEMPAVNKDGSYNTENYGGMVGQVTSVHNSFFTDAAPQDIRDIRRVYDIGCAFGINTLRALKKGAYVVAMDLDPRLLSILVQNVEDEYLDRLEILLGEFPADLILPSGSAKAILMSHIIHYFYPKQLMKGLEMVRNGLAENGKVYITAITPHYGSLSDEELAVIKKTVEDSLKMPDKIGKLEEKNWKLAFPTYIAYLFPGGEDFVQENPRAFVYHPQDAEVTKIYLQRLGFKVLNSGHFISPTQVSRWKKFQENGFGTLPVIVSGRPSPRGVWREDFGKYAADFKAATSLHERNSLIEKLTPDSLWPVTANAMGGNMYIVAQKKDSLGQDSGVEGKMSKISLETDSPNVISCNFCHATGENFKLCSRCKTVRYCNQECQRQDWKLHKAGCLKK